MFWFISRCCNCGGHTAAGIDLAGFIDNKPLAVTSGHPSLFLYFLMPCYVYLNMLTAVAFMPHAPGQVFFDAILQFWGLPALAFLTPDYRGLEYPLIEFKP